MEMQRAPVGANKETKMSTRREKRVETQTRLHCCKFYLSHGSGGETDNDHK